MPKNKEGATAITKTKHESVNGRFRTSGMISPKGAWVFLVIGVVVLISFYLLFQAFPNLDQQTTSMFFNHDLRQFDRLWDTRIYMTRRMILNAITVFYFANFFLGLYAYRKQIAVLYLSWRHWLFVGICGLVGPVLLVNILLKGNWGRARPFDTIEFGGAVEFTPFWQWADQCRDNCSFVSGEVASVVMIFLSLALVCAIRWRIIWIAVGVGPYLLTSWLRISTGYHFLSDALVSVPLMIVAAALTYIWFSRPSNLLLRKLDNLSEGGQSGHP